MTRFVPSLFFEALQTVLPSPSFCELNIQKFYLLCLIPIAFYLYFENTCRFETVE